MTGLSKNSIYPYGVEESLTPFVKGRKWGYFDIQGNVTIEPEFEEADYFSDGLAAVMVSDNWGYIDSTGRIVIEPIYLNAWPFQKGKALVSTSNTKYQLINVEGQIIKQFEGDYDYIDVPINNEERIRVEKDERFGYINFEGDIIIDCLFAEAGPFVNGLAWVIDENRDKYYINVEGQRAINISKNYSPDTFSEGIASVINLYTLKSCFINTSGQLVTDEEFYNPDYFSEGLTTVLSKEGMHFYINTSGKQAFNGYFEEAFPFIKGGALVSNDGVWGLIDKEGKYIFNNKSFDYIDVQTYLRNSNNFLVIIKGKSYYIKRDNGDVVFKL